MSAQCGTKNNHEHNDTRATGRRTLMKLGVLASGISLMGVRMPTAHAAGATEALLLSCMDFRLMDEIEDYMNARGMKDKYDHVVLAGASLGAITDKYPAWNRTFWDHLDIAIKLHGIEKVIVMDHRDCGAYKVILGDEHLQSLDKEKDLHALQLGKLHQLIKEKHPKLAVETLLMSLDGQVEVIETSA